MNSPERVTLPILFVRYSANHMFPSGPAVIPPSLLPLGIGGTFRIQRRGGFTITPSAVALAIGEPISVEGRSTRRVEFASREDQKSLIFAFEQEPFLYCRY